MLLGETREEHYLMVLITADCMRWAHARTVMINIRHITQDTEDEMILAEIRLEERVMAIISSLREDNCVFDVGQLVALDRKVQMLLGYFFQIAQAVGQAPDFIPVLRDFNWTSIAGLLPPVKYLAALSNHLEVAIRRQLNRPNRQSALKQFKTRILRLVSSR